MMEYRGHGTEVELDESVGRLQGWAFSTGPYPLAALESGILSGSQVDSPLNVPQRMAKPRVAGVYMPTWNPPSNSCTLRRHP